MLGTLAYFVYLRFLLRAPSYLLIGLGLAALLIGAISLATSRKHGLLLAFFLLFAGVMLTFWRAFSVGQLWLWVGGAAAQVFFGSLSQRS